MKRKMRKNKLAICFLLYAIFSILCGCLSWLLSDHRILMIQIWYQITRVLWLALLIEAVILLIRLMK